MIESMLVDDVTFYLAPTYADDASGGPNISALGAATPVMAHVGVAQTVEMVLNRQEGESLLWEMLVLQSDVTPNMKAIVLIGTCGRQPVNKYARVKAVEPVGNPGGAIPPYWQVTVEEYRETS